MIAALWKNDLRHWMIVLNAIVVIGLIVWLIAAVLSPKRARQDEIAPTNLRPGFTDDELETRRLERVQGWALIFAAIVAVALPLYWLREPTRQNQATAYFNENSIRRGAELFANSASPDYNAAVSLQCANCHGQKGVGGVAPTNVDGVKVAWKAPPLNTVLRRFTPDEVTQIITYGRPGTPMQPWGVLGGGPKNEQAIADLVQYLNSIQISPAEAQLQAQEALKAARSTDPGTSCPEYMSCPYVAEANAKTTLAQAKKDLQTQTTTTAKVLGVSDADVATECKTIIAQVDKATTVDADTRKKALSCGDYVAAAKKASDAQAAYDWSVVWAERRANVSDGQLLFEYSCARCHTKGWSIFDPTAAPGTPGGVQVLGLAGGGGGEGGGIGFNLRDNDPQRRFGSDASGGFASQQDFVTQGSEANKLYGNNGQGSGRMPGFGSMLTNDDIAKIVSYERYCLDDTTFLAVSPACATGTTPRTPPTTTPTTAATKG